MSHRSLLRDAVAELERAGAALWQQTGDPLEIVHQTVLTGWSGDSNLYQSLLDFTPTLQDGVYTLTRHRRSSIRRQRGTFYTPPEVIDYIVHLALGPLIENAPDILNLRVLDPATGGGHFLVAAARYLTEAILQTDPGLDPHEVRIAVVSNCIHGVDLDPEAVRLTRTSLAEFCGGEDPEMDNIRQGDSLRDPAEPIFDAVIGNPPYHSYSGRQRIDGGDELKALYRERGLIGGWASSHSYFMMQCASWLRPGGRAAMIVPDQVGHLERYGPLRGWLTQRLRVAEVRYWGDNVFAAARTPALTFCLANKPSTPGRLIRRDGSETVLQFGREPWHSAPSDAVFLRLLAEHPALPGFHDPGVHTGNAAAKLLSAEPHPGWLPLLEGKQLRPFGCDPPRLWLNPHHLREPGEYYRLGKPGVFTNTTVILRQTGDRPIAARHVHQCAFRNSILALKLPPGWSVEYALGVLNSDVVAWIYRQIAIESAQQNFPQVKIKTLRRLPLPDPLRPENLVLVREVEKLAVELERGPQLELRAALNRVVAKLFGLESWPLPPVI